MIRILVWSALPILGLGAATALLGPDLVTGPRGEPLIVAAPVAAALQEASFSGKACAFPLVLDEDHRLSDRAARAADTRVVTFAFRYDAGGASVGMEKGIVTNPDAAAALTLVFDGNGRIVAVTYPSSLRESLLSDRNTDCLESGAELAPAGI